jgi:hypothetical protein
MPSPEARAAQIRELLAQMRETLPPEHYAHASTRLLRELQKLQTRPRYAKT